MRMRTLDRRVHLLLDEARYDKLAREAERRHISVAAVIREAIDRYPIDLEARRAALDDFLASEPMCLPDDPADLRKELDAAREARSW